MIALTLAAAIGAALVAGIFFAFSTFVMRALARLRPSEGIAAMQSINVVVLNAWFLLAFFGTGVLSIGVVVAGVRSEAGLGAGAVLGSALYVLGCIGVTIVRNVPLNDRLAAVDAADESAQSVWDRYLTRWTFWNHVRTAASLAAAVAFLVGVCTP